jgi:hypothetical protein
MAASPIGEERGGTAEVRHQLVDRLHAHVEVMAADIEAALQAEVPEYRDRSGQFATDSLQVSATAARAGLEILRSGAATQSEEQARAWAALGRRRAEQNFPLHALVHSFQISIRIFLDYVAREVATMGPDAGAALAGITQDVLREITQGVAIVSEAYAATRHEHERGRDEAARQFFSDLALGLLGEHDHARAVAVGLRRAQSYVAITTPLEGGDLTVPGHHIPPGCVWGTVGTLGVCIVPLDGPERADIVAGVLDQLSAGAGDTTVLAVGTAHAGLAGLAASFQEAVEVLGVARRLGLAGVVRPEGVLVPGLLLAAPALASRLAAVVAPLLPFERPASGELVTTLRVYLAEDLSVRQAAERLFVHRNTLRARLHRIEELLGLSVDASRLVLELGLLAHQLGLAEEHRDR